MAKYSIAGYDIEIPESVENYENYMNTMLTYCYDIDKEFDSWYTSQWNCHNVYSNIDNILDRLLDPIIKKGIDLLSDYGVYDIDYNTLQSEYLADSFNGLNDVLDKMLWEIDDIIQKQMDEKEYRQIRKATRGRVVGGGFGLGGAIKGMAQAGAINVTTGAIHSVGNIIGNTGSAISAGANKNAVYDKYRKILAGEIESTAIMVIDTIMRCIQKNTGMRFDYLIDGKSPNADISKSILNNYREGKIPDDKQLEQLIRALKNDLRKSEIYEAIWEKYGDESGDLKRMALFFGVPLEKRILERANDYCKRLFWNCFEKYKDNINPVLLAIKTENDLIHTLEEMKRFCKERDIKEDEVSYINKCEELIIAADVECRSVDGVLYESRRVATAVQNDKSLFYSFLDQRNLYLNETYEKLSKLAFKSTYYKENLKEIFQEQIKLADSSKIFSNLNKIMKKYFPDGKTSLGAIEFARIEDSLLQKENIIRSITKMPENEIPIMLINYESNGKSGIIFTNLALRIYCKGLIFADNKYFPYETIENVLSLGTNKYQIDLKIGADEFEIKSGLNYKELNELCHFLNESIRILKMLKNSERVNLKWISENSIRCMCGELMPAGSKICPSCFRMYTKEGNFVDTMQCRYCGNRIISGKKFCSKCGKPVLPEEGGMLVCRQCGNLIKYGKRFCSICGTQISVKDGE